MYVDVHVNACKLMYYRTQSYMSFISARKSNE